MDDAPAPSSLAGARAQRNSLQFQTNDPPRLALADAAQQARRQRQRRGLQHTHHPHTEPPSAESSFTPSTLEAPTPVSTATPHLTSPPGYALFGRLRSPRASNTALAGPTPEPPLSPSALAGVSSTTLTAVTTSLQSPYEQATSAQTLLKVLKERQMQRASRGAHVYYQPAGLLEAPLASAASHRHSLTTDAPTSTTGTVPGEVSTPTTSVYPQMRPRAGDGGTVESATHSGDRGTDTARAGGAIPFSSEAPHLSSQMAARGAMPSAPVGQTLNNDGDGCREVEADDEEDEDARARAAGAVGLEPVLCTKPPVARCFMLNLLTTWGDEHEIGLCGVEFFDQRGDRIPLEPRTVPAPPTSDMATADQPCLVNDVDIDGDTVCRRYTTHHGRCLLLAQYAGTPEEIMGGKDPDELATDPRGQLSSLVNGLNNTHDEANMFVMPYTPGEHHLVCFIFTKAITLSMIRLINYCGRGRVHTAKGARIVEITADDVCVFRGEVAQHSGNLLSSERSAQPLTDHSIGTLDAETDTLVSRWGVEDCENILFTEDPVVLERVMKQTRAAALRALLGDGNRGDHTSQTSSPSGQLPAGETAGQPALAVARAAVAPPAPKLVLSASKDAPRGDRSRYVGGEAPMAVSARLMPTQVDLKESCSTPICTSSRAAPGLLRGEGQEVPPQPARAASSGGGRPRGSAARDRGATQTWASPSYSQATPARTTAAGGDAPVENGGGSNHETNPPRRQRAVKPRQPAQCPRQCPTDVRSVCLELLSTWGDTQNTGLSGLRFRDAAGDIVRTALDHWTVQYPDGQRLPAEVVNTQLSALFDEDDQTACLLPFQPAMQIILVFSEPVARLGFLEVANYSHGEHTFCGAKDVRVFLCSAPVIQPAVSARVALPPTTSAPRTTANDPACTGNTATTTTADGAMVAWCPHTDVFARLWTVATSPESVAFLQAHRVREVTPVAGVSLRKAPANLVQARFQTYDLSLAGNDGLDAFDALADTSRHPSSAGGDSPHAASRWAPIGVGPGTGGDRLDVSATLATGGLRAGFSTTMASFATSLNASMNIRAAMSMKRARMMLKDRPEWLLDYQPYVTPLLPVGYVCRVRLQLCARTVGESAESAGDVTRERNASPDTHTAVYSTAAENLKSYLRLWVLKPLRACSFVNENGDVVRPVKPGKGTTRPPTATSARFRASSRHSQSSQRGPPPRALNGATDKGVMDEEEEEDTRSLAMVAECIVSELTGPELLSSSSSTSRGSAPLRAQLELLYVADSPFCLSMMTLNSPLVLDGCAAWTKRVQVYMDDTMVFDSGEAVLKLRRPESAEETMSLGENMITPPRGRTADGTLLPRCTTSLRPFVLFTLDESLLEDVRRETTTTASPPH